MTRPADLRVKSQVVKHGRPIEISINRRKRKGKPFTAVTIDVFELDRSSIPGAQFWEGKRTAAEGQRVKLASFSASADGSCNFKNVTRSFQAKNLNSQWDAFPTLDVKLVFTPGQQAQFRMPVQELLDEWRTEKSRTAVTFELGLTFGGNNQAFYVSYQVPIGDLEKCLVGKGTKQAEAYKDLYQKNWRNAFLAKKNTSWAHRMFFLEAEMAKVASLDALNKEEQRRLFNLCLDYHYEHNVSGWTWGPLGVDIPPHFLPCKDCRPTSGGGSFAAGKTHQGDPSYYNQIAAYANSKNLARAQKEMAKVIDAVPVAPSTWRRLTSMQHHADSWKKYTDKVRDPLLRILNKSRGNEKYEPTYTSVLYEFACRRLAHRCVTMWSGFDSRYWSRVFPAWTAAMGPIMNAHPLYGYMLIDELIEARDKYLKTAKNYEAEKDLVYWFLLYTSMHYDRPGTTMLDIINPLKVPKELWDKFIRGKNDVYKLDNRKRLDFLRKDLPPVTRPEITQQLNKSVGLFQEAVGVAYYAIDGDACYVPKVNFRTKTSTESKYEHFYQYQNEQNQALVLYSRAAAAAYQFAVFGKLYLSKLPDKTLYTTLQNTTMYGTWKTSGITAQMSSTVAVKWAVKIISIVPMGKAAKASKVLKWVRRALKVGKKSGRAFSWGDYAVQEYHFNAQVSSYFQNSDDWRVTTDLMVAAGIVKITAEMMDGAKWRVEAFFKTATPPKKAIPIWESRIPPTPTSGPGGNLVPIRFTARDGKGNVKTYEVASRDFYENPAVRLVQG